MRSRSPERPRSHAPPAEVITALGASDLWCLEHGAHVGRMLVETRIQLAWMAAQDPSIYRAYQEYGAGKAKLYARILEDLSPRLVRLE